ncbi:hypothetical protein VE00_00151 [Pseudogymnoascus sp. WSF 3629]|nr:hypothetical protein VE00_00151 [Pseudogymnoascus sp. WSF 3629]
MAGDKAITNAILETVRELFKTDLDSLSVNNVRKVVEEQLDLSSGFLKGDAWKAKSKELITGEVAKLDEATSAPESPAPAPKPKSKPAPQPKVTKKPETVKKGTKRAAPAKAAAPKKRQKKEATPSSSDELSEPESEAEESEEEAEFSDSDVSEAPRTKKRAAGGRGKKGKKEVTESEEESEAEETPSEADSDASEAPKKKTAKPKTKATPRRASTASRKSSDKVVSEDEEEEEEVASPVKPNPVVVAKSKPLPTVEKPDAENDKKPDTTNQAAEDSDSDLSVLIDEPPKRSKSGSKSAKPSTSKTPKAAPALSPDDAEIKTLQSQLVKCGIRKIWQFELKDYGDDSKAKIRHLKGMLKEVGMEGRFSEARAREIKEMRELAQDVEAVTEGAKLWGKRGRRSEGKKAVSQEVESGSEEESEEEVRPARRAARKDDLAFLGDESESD